VSGQQHAPATLYPRERPGTHCTGGWVGPRTGLDGRIYIFSWIKYYVVSLLHGLWIALNFSVLHPSREPGSSQMYAAIVWNTVCFYISKSFSKYTLRVAESILYSVCHLISLCLVSSQIIFLILKFLSTNTTYFYLITFILFLMFFMHHPLPSSNSSPLTL